MLVHKISLLYEFSLTSEHLNNKVKIVSKVRNIIIVGTAILPLSSDRKPTWKCWSQLHIRTVELYGHNQINLSKSRKIYILLKTTENIHQITSHVRTQAGLFKKSLYWICYNIVFFKCHGFGPETCRMLEPWSEIELLYPALEGEVLITGAPGKFPKQVLTDLTLKSHEVSFPTVIIWNKMPITAWKVENSQIRGDEQPLQNKLWSKKKSKWK